MTLETRMRWIDPGVEHCGHQGLLARPLKAVSGAVQIDVDAGIDPSTAGVGVCHDTIFARGWSDVAIRFRWLGCGRSDVRSLGKWADLLGLTT